MLGWSPRVPVVCNSCGNKETVIIEYSRSRDALVFYIPKVCESCGAEGDMTAWPEHTSPTNPPAP